MNATSWKLDLLEGIALDQHLTASDFRVAFCIVSHRNAKTGDCCPKPETIADQLGVTDRGVRLAISNLRVRGWVSVEYRPQPNGRGRVKHYVFRGDGQAAFDQPASGTTVPENDANFGMAVPEENANSGTAERTFRNVDSGAILVEEHVKQGEHVKDKSARKRATSASKCAIDIDGFRAVFEGVLKAEIIDGLVDTRKAKRGAITPLAAKHLLEKLRQFPDPESVAKTMIVRGWLWVEAEWLNNRRTQPQRGHGAGQTLFDAAMEELENPTRWRQ